MGLNRRDFLQRLGLTLVSLGIVDRWSWRNIDRYAHALSTFKGRKFALLIGINGYSDADNLAGCLTDVRIQKQVLMHQFGFAPEDILTLTDREASRDNIFTMFQKDLKELLTPDDFLFVHFSGYGTRINLSANQSQVAAIMPVDGVIGQSKTTINNAIAVATLEGLMRSLNPAQAALVLDTSFDPVSAAGHHYWRGRTYPKTLSAGFNPSETAIAEQLQYILAQQKLGKKSILRLMAAQRGWGTEVQLNDSAAGLFTVSLARCVTALNPQVTMAEAQGFLSFCYRQVQLRSELLQLNAPKASPLYGLLPVKTTLPAAGQIVATNANNLDLLFSGLEPEIYQAIAANSQFQTAGSDAVPIRLTSKTGIFGQGKTSGTMPTAGSTIQEKLRIYPRNLTLKIALGNNLSRIERVDATSAFAGIVGVANISNPPEWADYVFDAGYQLFSVTGDALPGLIPLEENEAIKSSVDRLQPIFEQLLALKWLRLLVNETSARLPMTVGLDRLEPKRSPLAERQTPQAIGRSPSRTDLKVLLGEPLLYHFNNAGTQPLYFLGFAQSSKQELILLTPQAGLMVPPSSLKKVTFEFEPLRPLGTWHTYWIGSDRPFKQFQLLLDKLFAGLEATPTKIEKPLPLVLALLKDLHLAPTDTNDNKENYRLSSENWVTSRFVYEVTEML
ncbi:MAG: caspase family protein [Limnothrix sp. RL_2_0]|nr:caspase family protein [Limnothrix sp. RL_2_0]